MYILKVLFKVQRADYSPKIMKLPINSQAHQNINTMYVPSLIKYVFNVYPSHYLKMKNSVRHAGQPDRCIQGHSTGNLHTPQVSCEEV